MNYTLTDRLSKLGKSRYWLGQQLGGTPSESAIYTYLNASQKKIVGRPDMTGDYIAKILDVLDAEEKRQRG